MKRFYYFLIPIVLCACSKNFVQQSSAQEEALSFQKTDDISFYPAVFGGVQNQSDGTQLLLIREYGKSEHEASNTAYKSVIIPEKPYEDRFIPVQMQDSSLWTYADVCKKGLPIVPAVFEEVRPFKDGLGAVCRDGLWGFIDENGKLAVNFDYISVQDFYNGICIVSFLRDDKKWWGGIDKTGNLLFSIPDRTWSTDGVSEIYNFYEYDYAKGKTDNGECFISRSGEILLNNITLGDIEFLTMKDDRFDFEYGNKTLCVRGFFDDKLYLQTKSESRSTLYGAFDRSGKWIIEPVHKNYSEVIGIINNSKIEGIKPFLSTSVKDVDTKLFGLKDRNEMWLVQPEYAFILADKDNGYFILMTADEKFGVADAYGRITVVPNYEDIACIHTNPLYFCACRNGKYGIINLSGKELYPFENDDMIFLD